MNKYLTSLLILLTYLFLLSACKPNTNKYTKTNLNLTCGNTTYKFLDTGKKQTITFNSPKQNSITLTDEWLSASKKIDSEHQFLGFDDIKCRENSEAAIGYAKFFEPDFDRTYMRSFLTGMSYQNEEIFQWGVDQSETFKNRIKELDSLTK